MNTLFPHVNVTTVDGYIIYKIHSDSFRENDIYIACSNYCRLNPECYTNMTNNMIYIVNPNMTYAPDTLDTSNAPDAPDAFDVPDTLDTSDALDTLDTSDAPDAPKVSTVSTCMCNNDNFCGRTCNNICKDFINTGKCHNGKECKKHHF